MKKQWEVYEDKRKFVSEYTAHLLKMKNLELAMV